MTRVIIVVREAGQKTLDYSLEFDLPEVPQVGSYISIFRPDSTHSEDLVVRHVWWHVQHPETRAVVSDGETKVGKVRDVMVECDIALGPYARDRWREMAGAAEGYGVAVERFQVSRFSVRESDLKGPVSGEAAAKE